MNHERNILRMTLAQRAQHWLLILTFGLLVLTGLPNLFDPSPALVSVMSRGDVFYYRGLLHRIAGVGLGLLCAWHLLYILLSDVGHRDFKALLPKMKDARDALGTLAYQSGLARWMDGGALRDVRRRMPEWFPVDPPKYPRYTFIEKFEYLAVVWGSLLMFVTGLMLWFEEATMALFPLYVFDFVRILHSYEAILAFLAIIVWHMYQVHLRPGVFPMSRIWLDGRISLEEMREEHGEEYEMYAAAHGLPPAAGTPPGGGTTPSHPESGGRAEA